MSFITQPYPFFHQGRKMLIISASVVILGFLFEFLFEPFNVHRPEHLYSYWMICLIHSGSAAGIYLIYTSILAIFIDEDNWKIYKEFFYIFILLFLIGTGNFFIREVIYDNPQNMSLRYFQEEIQHTYLVGLTLILLIYLISYNYLYSKNQQKAESMNVSKKQEIFDTKTIQIKAQLVSDHFYLVPSELLCVRSDGNYLEFFLKNEEQSEKKIKRMTLKSAENQLSSFPFILKTHRAYLVNIRQIKKVSGNAQGYQLNIKNLDFNVPVSRSHIESFNKIFD